MKNLSNSVNDKDLIKNIEKLHLLNNIILLGNKSSKLNVLLDKILDYLLKYFDFYGGGVYLVNQENKKANIAYSLNLSEDFIKGVDNIDIDNPPYNIVFKEGKAIFAENYQELNPKHAEGFQITSMASIPLFEKDKVVGAINLASRNKNSFSIEEKELMEVIGREIGTVISKIRIENLLKEQKDNLQSIFKALNDMLFVFDYEGKILQTNPIVIDKLGYSLEELMEMNIKSLFPSGLSEVVKNMLQCIINETEKSFTMPLLTKQGNIIHIEINASKTIWEEQKVIINACRDITERKQIRKALEKKEKEVSRLKLLESDTRYYNILESTNDGYYEIDLKGNYIFLNSKFSEIFGYAKGDFIDRNFKEFVTPDTAIELKKTFYKIYNTGIEESKIQMDITLKNGFQKVVEASIYLKYDSKGEKIGYCGVIRDLTERVKAEAVVKEAQKELRKRYKELNCLYGITKLTEELDLEIEDIIHGTLHVIPFAWETPRLVHTRIIYGNKVYKTEGFQETKWFLKTKQEINKKKLEINVFSQEKTIFEKQELQLLNEIGLRLKNIIEKKETERSLKKSEERYRNILENMEDGYYEIDVEGNITFANEATANLLGFPKESLIGTNFKHYLDQKTWGKLINTFKNIYKVGFGIHSLEYEIQNNRGEKICIDSSAYLRFDEDGQKIGFHGLLRDVTDRKKTEVLKEEFSKKLEKEVKKKTLKLNEALEAQKYYIEQIMKSSQFKTNFMSTMSHELRTPLNSIIGFSDLLLEKSYGNLNEMQLEFLEDIKNSADHLLEMINHILDISKIEAGKLILSKEIFSLKNMMDQIHGTIKPLYSIKGLEFKIRGLNPQMFIYADPIRLKEIFLNLLSNAIKFTFNGSIDLTVEERHDNYIFKIKDTGIGIARKDFSLIFKDFKRINSPIVNSIPGSGLGLSLTKRLITLHGGEIKFFSILRKGTTFTFSIPKIESKH